MKPRYLTYMFALFLLIVLLGVALAPLVGVEALSDTEVHNFNGFSLMLIATSGIILYFLIKCEQLYDKNEDLAEELRLQRKLTKSAEHGEQWYKRRVKVLKDHADYFPEPFQTYLWNVIANGSMVAFGSPRDAREKPLPTATLYHEDYNEWQWYKLLVDLGAIDDYKIDYKHKGTVRETLDESDREIFDLPDIEVLYVE